MEKLISVEQAKILVSGSEERKNELIKLMNSGIESQAERGLRWAHLPNTANETESEWLKDELVINGFSVNRSGNPAVSW